MRQCGFFIFFVCSCFGSDLLHPRDFFDRVLYFNRKPMLLKEKFTKQISPTLIESTLKYYDKDVPRIIDKNPYSVKLDDYIAIKQKGVWNGYDTKKFNIPISLLLLHIIQLKKKYPSQKIFIIDRLLHKEILENECFKKIFESYQITIGNISSQPQPLHTRAEIIFSTGRQIVHQPRPKKVNRYAELQRAIPFELLKEKYNYYFAHLLKNQLIDPTNALLLKRITLSSRSYSSLSEHWILKKESVMSKHCMENNFNLFTINNKNIIPSLQQALALFDLFLQIRYAQVTSPSSVKSICILERYFSRVKSDSEFCEFLAKFNIRV